MRCVSRDGKLADLGASPEARGGGPFLSEASEHHRGIASRQVVEST